MKAELYLCDHLQTLKNTWCFLYEGSLVCSDCAKELTGEKSILAVALGTIGGNKGGAARAQALSSKRRSDIARKAAIARWGNKP